MSIFYNPFSPSNTEPGSPIPAASPRLPPTDVDMEEDGADDEVCHTTAYRRSLSATHHSSFFQYYLNGDFSDLCIKVDGRIFDTHCIIICSEAPGLVAAGTSTQLAVGHCLLELEDYDAETIKRVIEWCYRHTYHDGEYPDTVPAWLSSMTTGEVQDALAVLPGSTYNTCDDPQFTAANWGAAPPHRPNDSAHTDTNTQAPTNSGYDSNMTTRPLDAINHANPYDFNIATPSPQPNHHPRPSSPATHPPYALALLATLRVYLAAKAFQMPALQLLARARFVHMAAAHWTRYPGLGELVAELYPDHLQPDEDDCPQHDEPLRGFLCRLVATQCEEDYTDSGLWARLGAIARRRPLFARDILAYWPRLRVI